MSQRVNVGQLVNEFNNNNNNNSRDREKKLTLTLTNKQHRTNFIETRDVYSKKIPNSQRQSQVGELIFIFYYFWLSALHCAVSMGIKGGCKL